MELKSTTLQCDPIWHTPALPGHASGVASLATHHTSPAGSGLAAGYDDDSARQL